MKRLSILFLAVVLLLVGCGEATATTPAAPQPTPTIGNGKCDPSCSAPVTLTPTATPIKKSPPVLTASDLTQLLESEGKVTWVGKISADPNGLWGVGFDVLVYHPTQSRVKYLNYWLCQYFFGVRHDFDLINVNYHSDTNDSIATSGGTPDNYKPGYDVTQLWDAMDGQFNVDLPA